MKSLTAKHQLLAAAVLLLAMTAVGYWPVLHNDFINYDDPDYVTANEVVRKGVTWEGVKWAFTSMHASNWHPLTWLSHMVDVQLFGLNPMGHHAMNLLLHGMNAVLLLLLLWRMTGAIWRSALVGALFALHPLHVESVAWVAERKDVLSTCFGLSCLIAYANFAQCSRLEAASSSNTSQFASGMTPCAWRWYAAAFLLLALGLMSKPMLVTWPFVMLLLDFWPLQRIEPEFSKQQLPVYRRLLVEKLPFLALSVASSAATFLAQQGGGAVTNMENLPMADRLTNAIVSYVKYLAMTVKPSGLAIFYPHPDLTYPASTQWPAWAVTTASLMLLAVTVITIRFRRTQPYLLPGWFWYLGTMVPVIGLVQVGAQALADRYSYVPLIGIFIIFAWGLPRFLRFRNPVLVSATSGALSAAVIIGCGVLAHRQVLVWRDDFSLFGHALQVTRGNAPAHSTLGKAFARRGDFEQALAHLRAAEAAYPYYPHVHYDTGLTLFFLGRYSEAIDEYLAELAQAPNYSLARNNLAAAYRLAGKPDAAIEQYETVLRTNPDFLQSLYGLGSTLADLGRAGEAEPYLRHAMEIDPALVDARLDLADVLADSGRYVEAMGTLTNFNGWDDIPRVQAELGNILMDSGQTNQAVALFREIAGKSPALADTCLKEGQRRLARGEFTGAYRSFVTTMRLTPAQAEAYLGLGLALGQAGKMDAALPYLEKAVALKPDATTHYHLAVAYAARHQFGHAVEAYRQVLKLDPNALAALNNLAWILATQPDPILRNGQLAVEYAERACRLTGNKQPLFLGTLAAAYAECGRFADAVRVGEEACQLAQRNGLEDLAKRNAELVKLYQNHKPNRDSQ